jgi:hypothetical protein
MKRAYLNLIAMVLLTASAPLSLCPEAGAQTAQEIESVIKSSKHVDKTRPVRAVVGSSLTTVSTYCHPKARDQDCKISALFIMKELSCHFKTLHRLRINFFDPNCPDAFRAVEVSEGDIALVDGGKPVQEVLSQLPLSKGKLKQPTAQPATQPPTAKGPYMPAAANSMRLNAFTTSDGDISMLLPEGAHIMQNPVPGTALKCSNSLLQISVGRHQEGIGRSFSDIVLQCELVTVLGLRGWQKLREDHQRINSQEAFYEEGTVGAEYKLRLLIIRGRYSVYTMTMMNNIDRETLAAPLAQKIIQSITVRG